MACSGTALALATRRILRLGLFVFIVDSNVANVQYGKLDSQDTARAQDTWNCRV
jgi:hypothetical protein